MVLNAILSQLFNHKTLSQQQAEMLFSAIVSGQLSNEQLAGALIALKIRGETIEEITGAVNAILANASPFPPVHYPIADIVGTGGDGANTINISTASAIVAASYGIKIAKHGNRSVSSQSGASDVLQALGVNIAMSAQSAHQALDEINLCFLWAQQYHSGFKHAVAVRQALKTRTLFNILGPLCNPARPQYHLLGVYSPELIQPYAEVAMRLGHQHTIIVHGAGLDEVAIHGITEVAEVTPQGIERYALSPQDFGFQPQSLASLRGGNALENAKLLTALLQGKGKIEHTQAVAMNCALLLKLFGQNDLRKNAQKIISLIETGQPFQTLTRLTQY